MPSNNQKEAAYSRNQTAHEKVWRASQEAWSAVDQLRAQGGEPVLRVSLDNRKAAQRHAMNAIELLLQFLRVNGRAISIAERQICRKRDNG